MTRTQIEDLYYKVNGGGPEVFYRDDNGELQRITGISLNYINSDGAKLNYPCAILNYSLSQYVDLENADADDFFMPTNLFS